MKRVMITGAGGTVGQAIISALLANKSMEYEVIAATSNTEKVNQKDRCLHVIPNHDIERVMKESQIDTLVHLAFPRNAEPDQWAEGIAFSMDILYKAQKHHVRKIINTSSQSIYGLQRERAADEESSIYLNSPYTTGKYCTELIVNEMFQDRPHTNVRLSTIIGASTKERVTNKFFSRIIRDEDIIVQGGMQVFSFLDVRDAASGFVSLIGSDGSMWKKVYNLGTHEYKTLLEIAQMAVQIGKKYGYEKSGLIVQPADITLNNQIISTSFQKDFQWTPEYDLRSSMEYIFTTSYNGK